MKPRQLHKLEQELDTYSDYFTTEMGRPERCQAMRDYLLGLLLEGRASPPSISGHHERLHYTSPATQGIACTNKQ